ncbi:MAG: Gfo/Idh/MocA family oxidoreductase [Ornithinimicrobium sp.]
MRPDPSAVRVGVLGCGRIAQMFHLPVLRGLPGVRLVVAADIDPQARAAVSRLVPGVALADDTAAVLDDPEVEAVVIALPTHLHAEVAVAAFAAGKHVYVEKPLGVDLSEGLRVQRAWTSAGLVGAVGFNFRFHPLHQIAADSVARHQLGEVVALRAVFSSAPRDLPEWKRQRVTGGGALLDLASHHVDMARHILGVEVDTVSASIVSRHHPLDTAALTLTMASGVIAHLMATSSAAASDRLEVFGTEATLEVDRMGRRQVSLAPTAGRTGVGAATEALVQGLRSTVDRIYPPAETTFKDALGTFVTAIRTGRYEGPTIEDGVRAGAILEAAERSAGSGRVESVSALPGGPASG